MASGVLPMKPFGEIPTLLAVLACLALLPTARAEVYKWVDDEGVVHYSAEPPEHGRESTELAVPTTPRTHPPATASAEPQDATPWYEQWLAEQRARRLQEKEARAEASAGKGAEQAQLLETCVQARQRLKVLETPCRVFFDGRGILRNWCRYETTYAYSGEFRFLEDDERANMLDHYRRQVEACAAAGY